jgi:hypothetical protein
MSSEKVIDDPVLGTLRGNETGGYEQFFEGETDLTPKHRVHISFTWSRDAGSLADGLVVARDGFRRVQRNEWAYRLAAAEALLPDIEHFFDYEGTAEEIAKLLTITWINLHSRDAGCILHYDSGGEFSESGDYILVEFDESGVVIDCEL